MAYTIKEFDDKVNELITEFNYSSTSAIDIVIAMQNADAIKEASENIQAGLRKIAVNI